MAEKRRYFMLDYDLIHTISKMPDDKAGLLFKHIFEYVHDQDAETDDLIVELTFEPIKQQLQKDFFDRHKRDESFSEAGKTSAKSRRLISEPQMYIIKMFDDNEEFIKIGSTYGSIGRRLSSNGDGFSKVGYKFEILHQVFQKDIKLNVVELETLISENFNAWQYIPLKKFGGYTECYNISILKDIQSYIELLDINQQGSITFNKVQPPSTRLNNKKKGIVIGDPELIQKIDYQEIINIFNELCSDLPQARLTDRRIKMIDSLLKKYSLQDIGLVFKNTRQSDYLTGKVKDWRASLDWLLEPANFLKVLEGNYANIKHPEPASGTIENQLNEASAAVKKFFDD